MNGCIRFLHPSGNLKEKSCWLNDKPDGDYQDFSAAGLLQESGQYENGEKKGFWKSFHPTGKLKAAGRYSTGSKDGLWQYFHADSSEAYREEWREGLLQSVSDFRDEKGRVHTGGTSKNGFGTVRRYFDSGIRKQLFFISAGEAEGTFSDFDSLGRIIRTREFRKGELNGVMNEFYPDSSLASSTRFVSGQWVIPKVTVFA
jgi:antitoxin component YwqK of YwqJK toxin-antitoxin module